jgi:DNA-binding transcriptional LysR family regulator
VVVHRSHPLAGRKRLRYEETLTHTVVRVAPGGLMDALLRRQAALGGKVPVTRIQVSSLEAACRIVGAGLGLAVMPREAAEPHSSTCNLRVIPLSDPWAKRRFVICSRDNSTLTTATRLLREYLGSHARHTKDVARPSARRPSSD